MLTDEVNTSVSSCIYQGKELNNMQIVHQHPMCLNELQIQNVLQPLESASLGLPLLPVFLRVQEFECKHLQNALHNHMYEIWIKRKENFNAIKYNHHHFDEQVAILDAMLQLEEIFCIKARENFFIDIMNFIIKLSE